MSIYSISQLKCVANASRTHTVGNLATGVKVSWKSIPSLCSKPLTTTLDLYRRELSGFVLILNTHLVLRPFLLGSNLADFHVPFHSPNGTCTHWLLTRAISGNLRGLP